MTWEQIRKLHDDGFEIGNHTRRLISVGRQTEEQLHEDIEYIEKQCEKHGIPKPVSFCYPAYQTTNRAVRVLMSRGYQFARAGGSEPMTQRRMILFSSHKHLTENQRVP